MDELKLNGYFLMDDGTKSTDHVKQVKPYAPRKKILGKRKQTEEVATKQKEETVISIDSDDAHRATDTSSVVVVSPSTNPSLEVESHDVGDTDTDDEMTDLGDNT